MYFQALDGNTGKDMTNKEKKPTGPVPERLKLEGDWQALIGKALKKQRPKEGWPKPKAKKRATKRSKP